VMNSHIVIEQNLNQILSIMILMVLGGVHTCIDMMILVTGKL